MMHPDTQRWFETIASNGTWGSKYHELNAHNYNFFTRRNAVAHLLRGMQARTVLDIGCGTGDYVEILRPLARTYVGIDYADSMVRTARDAYGKTESPPSFVHATAEELPFETGAFDLVVAIGFIEYFSKPEIPLREIARVTKPGGIAIVQSYKYDVFSRLFKMYLALSPRENASRLLRRIRGRPLPKSFFIDIRRNGPQLDALMRKANFNKRDSVYNNYYIMPRRLAKRFTRMYVALSEHVSKHQSVFLRPFAVNYIGVYERNSISTGEFSHP